jgi:hypothetical protein
MSKKCPTIYRMAGVVPQHDHFGKTLQSLLAGDAPHRDAVFCEGGIR